MLHIELSYKNPLIIHYFRTREFFQAKSFCFNLIVVYRVSSSRGQRRDISAGDFTKEFSDCLDILSTPKGYKIIADDLNIKWMIQTKTVMNKGNSTCY